MSKNKVLVLGGLDEDAITELKDDCEVMMGLVSHRPEDDYEWLLENIANYDAVIDAKIIIDKRIIDRAKNLKIISTFGVNYNFIDVDYARQKGI